MKKPDRDNKAGVAILCPMDLERRAVERGLRRAGLEGRARVIQTGIGKTSVVEAVERVVRGWAEAGMKEGLVVLAGAAGGLKASAEVPAIAAVVDEHGQRWELDGLWTRACGERGKVLPAGNGSRSEAGVVLVGVDSVVSTPTDKRRLAAQTGASIVDMESHGFVTRVEEHAREGRVALDWSVVRGVSDTPEETLPGEVVGWLDEKGNTRVASAMMGLARKPRLMPMMWGVMRRTRRVLPRVGERVAEVVRMWENERGE